MQTNINQSNNTHPDWAMSWGCAHECKSTCMLLTWLYESGLCSWLVVWGRTSCHTFYGNLITSAAVSSGWSWC